MLDLPSALLLGLLSSVHCLGMCGGFVVTIGATRRPFGPLLLRQIVYGAGRVTTYAFLGAVAGFSGLYLSRFDTTLITVQQVFSIVAGLMMLFIGASILGVLRLRLPSSSGSGSLLAPLFKQMLGARGVWGFFLAGIANGFLPCGLVYVFVAKAVAAGTMSAGALVMVAFGLGTVPALVALGCGGSLLGHAARHRIFQVAACVVILVGAITIMRALPLGSPSSHCRDGSASVADASAR